MVKVMYNYKLVYKIAILAVFGITLWTEKVAATKHNTNVYCVDPNSIR